MWRTNLSLLLVTALCAADRYQASEPHMGTLVSITLYADSPEQAQRAFMAAFDRIRALDAILSDYKPDSELSRVCQSDAPVSPELRTVLTHAQRLAKETGGAFDITAGPLTHLWRQARKEKRFPAEDEVRAALARSGYRKLVLDGGHVQCRVQGMKLDAGGIAKGYAADEALAALRRAGVVSALVAVSGDVAVSDSPPGQPGWRVRVQNEVISLKNAAVSTSGDEFQFLEIDGVRYSHILDPRTGKPLRDTGVVSVIARSGMEADGIATALSVLGPDSRELSGRLVREQGKMHLFDVRD